MDQQYEVGQSGVSWRRAVCDRRPPRALPTLRGCAVGALLLAMLANSACYHYVPVSPAATAPNQKVRVHITQAAAADLVQELGTYSTELDGTVAVRGSDSLAVTVPIARQYKGITLDSTTQVLVLGESDVVDVRRSKLSRSRTILTSVAAVVGFALLVHGIVQLTDPNPGEDTTIPPPPPPNGRITSGYHLSVRIPFP
jgi:hypothetical protein